MRILLVQNSPYDPVLTGADKTSRILLEELAKRKHLCRVVAPSANRPGLKENAPFAQFLNELRGEVGSPTSSHHSVSRNAGVFLCEEVEVHALATGCPLRAYLTQQIDTFEPTWTLVSSEDTGQLLLEAALKASPARVIYLAHATLRLPFGPGCFFSSPRGTELLRQTAGIITVSNFLKAYIRQWSGLDSVALPLPLYGAGPFPRFGLFDSGFVTMINPCAIKGISIFLGLAQKLPEIQFAAVPTWGTTKEDRRALGRLPNVRLLRPVEDIDEIFSQTRVLLVPSLCAEGKAKVIVEAMLRGIPVLASNGGGNPEAKLGVDYLLPVRAIERYEERSDDMGNPTMVPVVPEQDIGPWFEALRELLSDRGRYESLSTDSRDIALAYVSNLGIAPLEDFLQALATAPRAGSNNGSTPAIEESSKGWALLEQIEKLSPERRALLAVRLGKSGGKI